MFKRLFVRATALFLSAAVFMSVTSIEAKAAIGPGQAIAKGVDISKWNGNINWSAVASQGYSFAFLKLGSAKSGLDPTFVNNFIGAYSSGMRVGAYIYSYASNVESAVAEATFAVTMLQNVPVSFPVVIDIEDNVQKNLSPAQQQAIVNAFCQIVETAGYYPMVYASKDWFLKRLGFTAWDQWVAQYNTECDYPLPFAIWQASCEGIIPGVNGKVDIDYLYKDYSAQIIPYGWALRRGIPTFYENWHLKTGWINYAGAIWYADQLGHMVTGWQDLEGNGNMRYFYPEGPMAIGLVNLAADTYFFDATGVMQKGWVDLSGFRMLFSPEGKMIHGWHTDQTGTYYLGDNGAAAVGLCPVTGDYYYFDALGRVQKGWQNLGGSMYYFEPQKGKMVTGWFSDTTGRHYMLPSGQAVTGWQNIEGKTLYFDETTTSLKVNSFIESPGARWYALADGQIASGWTAVNGVNYYFDPLNGNAMAQNTVLEIEGVMWQFDINGIGTQLVIPVLPAGADAASLLQGEAQTVPGAVN